MLLILLQQCFQVGELLFGVRGELVDEVFVVGVVLLIDQRHCALRTQRDHLLNVVGDFLLEGLEGS